MTRRAMVGAMLVMAGMACVAPAPGTRERAPVCQPRFADADGWLGGDTAYSVSIDALQGKAGGRTTLWLFGDSFVADESGEAGRRYPFVHNVIARSSCSGSGAWSIDFASKPDASGRPRAFFRPDPTADWARDIIEREGRSPYYWPFAGFVHGAHVFVALLRVAPSRPHGPFALPFRIVGTDIARLTPLSADPASWPVDILPFASNDRLVPASAFVLDGDYVHAFAFVNDPGGSSPRALARFPITALDATDPKLPDQWETLGPGGIWHPGLDASVATVVIDSDATEMSVHRDAASGEWWAVESGASATARDKPAGNEAFVTLRRATRIEGPWSPPEQLIPLPHVEDEGPGQPFCYGGKAHPQYSTRDALLVTYVCSLFSRDADESLDVLSELARRTDLYRPIPVRLPHPPSAERPSPP